jgi:DNA invertase Pin-like site-specific DNA recombinase
MTNLNPQLNKAIPIVTPPGKVGRPRVPVPLEIIKHLRSQGYSFRKIAALTGLGYGSVRRAWHSLEQKGETQKGGT